MSSQCDDHRFDPERLHQIDLSAFTAIALPRYDATVWDIEQLESAGTIYADVNGRSVMPSIVVPLPFIARPQAQACRRLIEQLEQFLTSPRPYGQSPAATRPEAARQSVEPGS